MNRTEEDRKLALIQLLMDRDALDADRDDAAMDLGEEFHDQSVLSALIRVASNPNEIDMILSSCGEAIGKIWIKNNCFNQRIYHALPGIARYGVYVVIKSKKPEWIEHYYLEEDKF